jgi:hypothetical protein
MSGTKCSVCGEPQRRAPGGFSCINGHGGADPAKGNGFDSDGIATEDDPLS